MASDPVHLHTQLEEQWLHKPRWLQETHVSHQIVHWIRNKWLCLEVGLGVWPGPEDGFWTWRCSQIQFLLGSPDPPSLLLLLGWHRHTQHAALCQTYPAAPVTTPTVLLSRSWMNSNEIQSCIHWFFFSWNSKTKPKIYILSAYSVVLTNVLANSQ